MRRTFPILIAGLAWIAPQLPAISAGMPLGDCLKKENWNKPACKALAISNARSARGAEAESAISSEAAARNIEGADVKPPATQQSRSSAEQTDSSDNDDDDQPQ